MAGMIVQFLFCALVLVVFAPLVALSGGIATPPSAGNINQNHAVDENMPQWLTASDAWLLRSQLEDGLLVDAVVSLDGSGNHSTIGAAIDAAPRRSTRRYSVYIKKGIYREYINVTSDIWNIMMMGDGIDATVISGNRSARGGYNTIDTATVRVQGKGFLARDLTIENTAGAVMEQAVAFMSESNQSALQRCAFRSYQDTLYAYQNYQFYKECRISGTVDFIFCDAAAVFQNCSILARLPKLGQENTVTAQGRTDPNRDTGFTFQFCMVAADEELLHANFTVRTYLGRPWKGYSRVVFMQSYLSEAVHPDGWIPWNESRLGLDTLYFAEYSNGGPGANVNARVRWPGVHSTLSASEAYKFTAKAFIDGDNWLPGTGVKYLSGL